MNLMIFDLCAVVSNFALKHVHNCIRYFPDLFFSYVVCIYNHFRQTNQNHHPVMGVTSHISCVYDAFSSYHVSFSLMMSLPMMVLCPGHIVYALFHSLLAITSVVSVAKYLKW